ncbi:putative reverse transcriptase domain-containing protein [Tanacetum coccineum]
MEVVARDIVDREMRIIFFGFGQKSPPEKFSGGGGVVVAEIRRLVVAAGNEEKRMESSSARDSSNVDGLAPWALRRDLEASRAQARVMEAELGTCQTEIALLKSKNKIGEKERELLNQDLENVERALSNVLEMVSVLESGENATLKKRLAETETKLVWARMERETTEGRLHESRVWNKMFYMDMVRIGAVPKPPSDDEDTEHQRKKSKNSTSDGTKGPSEPRGIFCKSLTKLRCLIMPPKAMSEACMREVIREQVAASMAEFMANINRGASGGRAGGAGAGGAGPAAPEITVEDESQVTGGKDKVTFATALSMACVDLVEWKNCLVGIDAIMVSMGGRTDIGWEYKPDSIELALLCLDWWSMSGEDKTDEVHEGEKRKGEGDRGGRGDNRRDYNRRQNQRRANAGAMTNVVPNDNEGNRTANCRCLDKKDVTCFNCNEKGHLKRDCPTLKKNGQGGNNRGAVYKLGAVDAQQDPKVVTAFLRSSSKHNLSSSSNLLPSCALVKKNMITEFAEALTPL